MDAVGLVLYLAVLALHVAAALLDARDFDERLRDPHNWGHGP